MDLKRTLAALMLALLSLSAAAFTEDFSHADWTDGVDSGDNGWAIRNAGLYTNATGTGNPAPSLEYDTFGTDNRTGHYAAKDHGLGAAAGYKLSVDIQQGDRFSSAQVLLGNNVGSNYGAGYMIRYAIEGGGTSGQRVLSVFENTGGTNPLPGGPTPNFAENLLGSQTTFTTVTLGGAEVFYTLYMDVRQDGPGQPFTITAWVDGFGSGASPLLSFTDSHDNGLDLADLATVAFTTQQGNDTVSHSIFLDNITVVESDTTDPVVTCPADYNGTIDGDPPNPDDTGTATATDDTDPSPVVTYVDTPATGKRITRTWTATDSSGNTATCDQTLTVSYLDDFEDRWANGTDDGDTSPHDIDDLGDPGASANGWTFRSIDNWQTNALGAPHGTVLELSRYGTGQSSWHTGGRQHGVPLSGATKLHLSFDLAVGQRHDAAMVWLSDATQNGYGIVVANAGTFGNPLQVRLTKLRGNTENFGAGTVSWTDGQWGADVVGASVDYGAVAHDDFTSFHLLLAQSAPGGNVTLTLWYTDAPNGDTSLASPAQSYTDTGAAFGTVIDLSDLTYAAVTAQNAGSNLTGSPSFLRFDNLQLQRLERGLVLYVH